MINISQLALALFVSLSTQDPFIQAFTLNPRPFLYSSVSPSTSNPLCIRETFLNSNTCLFMAASSKMNRLENSAVELTITAPAEATQAAYDKAVIELCKNVEIPGFRKGDKVPYALLENAMAERGGRNAIRMQAINDLANRLIEPALKEEHGLEPVGQPTLSVDAETLADNFVPGEDLEMKVKCDVWPEVKFKKNDDDGDGKKPYHGLKGKYKREPFDQAKLDVAFKDLKERYAELTPIDDPSHKLVMGDACVVNMDGFMAQADGVTKGEPLPDAASGDDVEVILGQGRYMEGLVEGLLGASVGETVQVTVTFPERLRDKTLAGKKAIFDVTVASVSKRVLPEVTDEWANKVRAGLTKESLIAELRKAVDEEDAKKFVNERNAALASALGDIMDMEIPDTIVTTHARDKYANMMAEFRDQGMDDAELKKQITPENFEKYKVIYKADIEKEFKITLAVEELAKLENIEVPDYKIEEQMENIKMDAQQSDEEFDESAVKKKVESTLQSRMVYDYLAENADLEIEFIDEANEKANEKIDEELLQKLAEDSLKREGYEGSFEDAEVVDETKQVP